MLTKLLCNAIIGCLALAFFVSVPGVSAQGTAEDYQRSSELTRRYRKAYRPNFPTYRWLKGGILLTEIGANKQKELRFIDGRSGKDRKVQSLDELKLDAVETLLKPLASWGRSKRNGSSVNLTFENTFDKPVRLFWSDFSGGLQSYGTVEANGKRSIPTYEGHQWVVDFRRDDLAGVFQVTGWDCTARINKDSQEAASGGSGAAGASVNKPPKQRLKIRKDNVWLIDEEAKDTQLTKNGTEQDPYAGRILYSPNGDYAFVFQATQVTKRRIPLVDSTPDDQVQPKVDWIDYVKPGDPLSQRRPKLFDLRNGQQIEVDELPFLDSWSVKFQGWSKDASHAYFLHNRRGHQELKLVAVRLKDGQLKEIVNESSSTFVDYSQKFQLRWLREGDSDELIWASERDGWNHLYRINALTGEVINQITTGEWVVRDVELIDQENKVIWFTAMGIRPEQDPYFRHLARVNFDGTGLVVLTEASGDHQWQLNPDRTLLLDRWSRVDQPEIGELRRATDGSLIKKVFEQDISKLKDCGFETPIRFSAPGRDGKTMIYGQLVRPSNFDPKKSYPVIENIYAGPHGFHVAKKFGLQESVRRLAELGFVVVNIDGMGTNWRSKKFHDVCFQNLKDSGFPDRIAWLKSAAKEYPWMDLSRVGIYGGSAGGQNSLAGLLHHGDFYKAAVSDCGCHDNRMDKIWWNEAWMGKLGPHYEQNSNVTHADKLKGKLMLTVGELDRNVDPSSTLQVVDALVRADKDFEFVIIPGAGHGIGESKYLFRRRQDFFVRNLLGVEPRR